MDVSFLISQPHSGLPVLLEILHQAACDERNHLSICTFSSQLLLNFTCCEKIIFLMRWSQSKHPRKREKDSKEEESKLQKLCQKWVNLNKKFLLGPFYMVKGRWRKWSSSFLVERHFKNIRVYQVLTQTDCCCTKEEVWNSYPGKTPRDLCHAEKQGTSRDENKGKSIHIDSPWGLHCARTCTLKKDVG